MSSFDPKIGGDGNTCGGFYSRSTTNDAFTKPDAVEDKKEQWQSIAEKPAIPIGQ